MVLLIQLLPVGLPKKLGVMPNMYAHVKKPWAGHPR